MTTAPTRWLVAAAAPIVIASGLCAQEARDVDVDGRALHVYTAGWEHIGEGRPVVVFEGGATTPIAAWREVLSRVAERHAVVAYDPPGTGGSPWYDHEPTVELLNARLRDVLDAVDAPPPYVLVAHSWASWAARGYVGRHPGETAGLVLIDPTPPWAEFLAAFRAVGAEEDGPSEFARLMQRLMAHAPSQIRAQQAVVDRHAATGTDPDVPDHPAVPVVVLVAGRYADPGLPDDLSTSFDFDAFLRELRTRQIRWPIEWVRASPDGMLILASEATHCIHCDDPELVAWVIERMIESAEPR